MQSKYCKQNLSQTVQCAQGPTSNLVAQNLQQPKISQNSTFLSFWYCHDIAKRKHSDLPRALLKAKNGLVSNTPQTLSNQVRKEKYWIQKHVALREMYGNVAYQCISWAIFLINLGAQSLTCHPALRHRAQFDLKPGDGGHKQTSNKQTRNQPFKSWFRGLVTSTSEKQYGSFFKFPLLHRNTTYESKLGCLLSLKPQPHPLR